MTISVIIVSWESNEDLLACVRSLSEARAQGQARGFAVELIVVDNGSRDFPQAAAESLWPGVWIVANSENRGFGPAANQGACQARGDILLFLNPDTRAAGEPFTPLVGGFGQNPGAVALAPRLLDERKGAEESQGDFQLRRLPTLPQAFREMLLIDRGFPRNPFRRRDRYAGRNRDVPFEVEQPAAAALAVRREVFVAIGGFDESFAPAWFEDVDLCARLQTKGQILYWPSSRFRHRGGGSASRLGYGRFLPLYYRNALRYWRKHKPLGQIVAFRALLAAGMLLRLLILPLRPHPPRPRREASSAYARVFRGSLGLGWPR